MKRSGFTLIELMIVIAIIAITAHDIFPSLQSLIVMDGHHTRALKDANTLTTLYGLFCSEMKLCGNVESADENGVRFKGNRVIKVLNGGREIQIGDRHVKLEGGSRCWGFEKVDDRTFSTQIKNGPDSIRAMWRTGASNE